MSQPQHMAALDEANRIRFARAALKRELQAGNVTLAEAFEHPDVGSMPVFALLCAQRRWGRKRALNAMNTAAGLGAVRISESKMVGELTFRQRDALIEACSGEGWRAGCDYQKKRNEARVNLVERVRSAMRPLGYAVGLHGSEQRDLDLIAVPWVENVESDRMKIADALRAAGFDELGMGVQAGPHGRLGFSLHGVPAAARVKYIDLSVMLPTDRGREVLANA